VVGFYRSDLGIVSAAEQNFWLLIPNCDVPRYGGGNHGDTKQAGEEKSDQGERTSKEMSS
jgi:hypothetical protein